MWVRPLGQEDPPEEEMVTHSSILACRITWTGEPGGLQSMGSHRVRHDWGDLAHTLIKDKQRLPTVVSWHTSIKEKTLKKNICWASQVHQWKEHSWQCRRCKRRWFGPWVEKIPWRRKRQLTPVFLPGESHGQRSLAGYRPWGHKESDRTEATEHASHRCIWLTHFAVYL